jgi:hypothetical protein
METIKNYFNNHGIKKRDFPKGFLIFNGIGVLTYSSILALSYRYRPLYNAFKQPQVQEFVTQLRNKYPNQYKKLNGIVDSQTLTKNRVIKSLVDKYQLDSERLFYSMGETSVIYKLGLPIIVPLHFWVTVHMLKKPVPPTQK